MSIQKSRFKLTSQIFCSLLVSFFFFFFLSVSATELFLHVWPIVEYVCLPSARESCVFQVGQWLYITCFKVDFPFLNTSLLPGLRISSTYLLKSSEIFLKLCFHLRDWRFISNHVTWERFYIPNNILDLWWDWQCSLGWTMYTRRRVSPKTWLCLSSQASLSFDCCWCLIPGYFGCFSDIYLN